MAIDRNPTTTITTPTSPQGQTEIWTTVTVNTVVLVQQTTWDQGRTTWDGGRTTWDGVFRGNTANSWSVKSEG